MRETNGKTNLVAYATANVMRLIDINISDKKPMTYQTNIKRNIWPISPKFQGKKQKRKKEKTFDQSIIHLWFLSELPTTMTTIQGETNQKGR